MDQRLIQYTTNIIINTRRLRLCLSCTRRSTQISW